jgi:hypothetical protein
MKLLKTILLAQLTFAAKNSENDNEDDGTGLTSDERARSKVETSILIGKLFW